ncbi:hypothetical protein bcCo53_001690 (plasmid) [Borrelia coriaceae]|uniref:Variable large protein n=1 Tax=Borrelia coriaceae ATCC 43381 TaxID=1408429 RepID=W5SXH9_9SPIR|nr:Vsp/OspC family lipoprotein [Borrelia coriaceae]AHH11620.1 hypothetical protein BCO_0900120 [Borrelia coriaceae ATCC 43381]UPA17485.1 hypothetical protein bcCo53_001690 [Borrelia coriaceae]
MSSKVKLLILKKLNTKRIAIKEAVKTKAVAFKAKLFQQNSTLGASGGTQDNHAEQAIDGTTNGSSGMHGTKELAELHSAVNTLIGTAKEILGGIIAPAKEVSPVN